MIARPGRRLSVPPDDPAGVHADDQLIEALTSARLADHTELLFALLAGWRREIHTEPIRELVDVDLALDVIRAAARASRR